MLATSFIALAVAAVSAVAQQTVEVPRTIPPGGDITILNYALTLEHLEAAFYAGALRKFSVKDFARAGYPAWVYQRVQTLASDEATHVSFLTSALGNQATAACTYSFPYNTVDEFLALSRILEGVGVSAYLGAAGAISDAAYLTAAGAILTVEARHNAVISEIEGSVGFPSAFDTPLGFSEVYTLAAPFIKQCPSTNPSLPVTDFPSLVIRTKNPQPGHSIALRFNPKGATNTKLQVISGLNTFVVDVSPVTGAATLPAGLTGRVYLIVTNGETLADNTVIAGPALLDITPKGTLPSFQKYTHWSKPTHWGKPKHGHWGKPKHWHKE